MAQSIIIWHNNGMVKAVLTGTNTTIYESWRFKTTQDMTEILEELREKSTDKTVALHILSLTEMVREWRCHNLCYTLGLFRNRTRDVDLNTGKPWYAKVLYTVISPLYSLFA